MILLPLVGLEAVRRLLWTAVSVGALVGSEKARVYGRVGQEDKEDDAPDKGGKAKNNEHPAPGSNWGADVTDGIC